MESCRSFLNNKSVFWLSVFAASALFFYLFSDICFPFVVGFVLAYLFAPWVKSLSKFFNRGMLSLLLTIGLVMAFAAIFIHIFPLIKHYVTLVARNLPSYYDQLINFLSDTFSSHGDAPQAHEEIAALKTEAQKYLNRKIYITTSILEGIVSRRTMITNFFSFFITMPISFFYFLKDWEKISNYFYDCTPIRHKQFVVQVTEIIRTSLKNFFHGQSYVVIIMSCYYGLLLSAADVPQAMLAGIISGCFSFIPFLGAMFSFFIVILLSAASLTKWKFIILLAIYAIGQLLEGYVLTPKFVSEKTGLHPLWMLFSFFAGFELFGIVGVLIAIPITAVTKNLVHFTVTHFKSTQIYKQ